MTQSNNDNAILTYYQKISNGEITVGKYVKTFYDFIIKGLEEKAFFFNQKKAKLAVIFIENFCRHHEGALGGQKIRLELWQKAFLSVVFGIEDENGARHFREVLLVVARKNGKTLLAAAIAAYMAFLDGEYGARIYFSAPKLEQANLGFSAFQQMIEKEQRLSATAQKRRTDIYIQETNTSIKPLAFSAKKSDGLNVSLAIADEVASWIGDAGLKFYEVIKSSQGARKQPLILSITTAGYDNDGIYDELIKRATRVLGGESKETRLAPFLYIIDDTDKWNDINELQKSNPNLNVSITVDYLLDELAIAEGSLSKKAEFITKYCNVKQNSSVAWLTTKQVGQTFCDHLEIADFAHSYAVAGIDLSRTTDLTAAVCLIEKDGTLYAFAQFFMPAEKLEEATARDGLPYNIYRQRGLLTLSGDNFVDYHDCQKWLTDLVEKYEILPLKVGYDRYTAQYLVQDLNAYGFQTDDVFQGFNLSPVIKELEGIIKDGKLKIGDNDLLKIHLLDSALKLDTDTDRARLIKMEARAHIDGTAALLDAMTVRQKFYGDIGAQLANTKQNQ